MPVLDRPELEASPLADLHAIADQLGLDGFRRLRKGELIDAILGERTADLAPDEPGDGDDTPSLNGEAADDGPAESPRRRRATRPPSASRRRTRSSSEETVEDAEPDEPAVAREPAGERGRGRAKRARSGGGEAPAGEGAAALAEGVVELLGNGSAFLRLHPPEPSDGDVYISAAQVRRCELVSGDRVSGPARTPRRSERYPSLVRIDTINGSPADAVSDGSRYEDLPVAHPSELLELGKGETTLEEIELHAPLGRGSRALIVGPAMSGKTETLRRLAGVLSGRDDLELTLVLLGARPEEIGDWQEGPVAPVAPLTFAASADTQGQALEQAIDVAKRLAARGEHALVLIDGLDGVHPQAARKALASARKLREGGSLTIVATATRPFGGESTVIVLDPARSRPGGAPALDLAHSVTLRPELLVGERGAEAIAKARAGASR